MPYMRALRVATAGGGDVKTATALYALHIDAFLEGLAAEVPQPETFGLNEKQATEVRRGRYAQRVADIRAKKGKAA
jgi:hypothetical protein